MKIDSPADRVVRQLRDRDFTENIANLICSVNAKAKTIYVLMGSSHIEGVQNMLSHISGGKIEFQTFRSYEEKDREQLNKFLQSALSNGA